jgi:hypothetical protein
MFVVRMRRFHRLRRFERMFVMQRGRNASARPG